MAGGRPSEYNENMLTKAQEYLASAHDMIDSHAVRQVKLPTIEGLSVHLCVSRETIYDWSDKFPEFSDIVERLRSLQAERLINNGLQGNYNSTITKLMLTKHGYVDKQELTGADGSKLFDDKEAKERGRKAIGKFIGRGDTGEGK